MRNFFSRGPRVGRPTPVPQATVNYAYPHCALVVIQPPMAPYPGGTYRGTVERMLNEIRATPVGLVFFPALMHLGKQIGIRYAGATNNQAAGGSAGYTLLRNEHSNMNILGFGAELQQTINDMNLAAGHDINWLANELYRTPLPRWNGTQDPSPYRTLPPLPVVPVMGGGMPPVPPTPPQRIAGMLNNWIGGLGLPTIDQMDVLMLVLAPWLRPGPGSNTRIFFDPQHEVVSGVPRPPHVGLFHELVHAYYNAGGRQLGTEDSSSEAYGGRLFELMSVGLGPFAPPSVTHPYSENALRDAFAVPRRLTYG